MSNPGNNYTGLTSVNNGTLRITNSGALGTGRVVVSSGGTLELAPDAGSNLDLNRGLTLAGGALASLRGNNIWRGDVGLTADLSTIRSALGSTLDVRGALSLQSGTTAIAARNLRIRGAGNVILSGIISGLGGLIKGVENTDTGRLRLTRNNTFAGAVSVNHGVLRIERSGALGTPAAVGGETPTTNTTVAAGATLELAGGRGLIVPDTETLSLAGDGARSNPADNTSARLGALRNVSGNNSIGAAITLAGAATIHNDATGRNRSLLTLAGIGGAGHNLSVTGRGAITISGAITTGTGGLSKTGTGKLRLTGVNTYTGDTNIDAGELELDNTTGNVIAQSANVILATTGGGSPKLSIASNQTIASLSGGGEVAIAPSQRLTVNKTTGATTYSGVISGASGGLSKDGAGTLTLGGANTYGGTTEVNNGALAITSSGALGNTSEVTVNSGGTLALNPAAGSNLSLSRGLTLAGGALASLRGNNTYSGNLTLTANSTIRSAAGSTLDVSGDLGLQTTGETPVARNLTIRGAGNVVLSGVIRGLGGLIKGVDNTDTGRLRLTRNNTFSGAVSVNHGVLRVAHNNALGAAPEGAASTTTVAAGATLELAPADGVSGLTLAATESLSLAGDGVNEGDADAPDYQGALRNVSGNNTVNGTITLADAATIHNAATGGNSLTLAGISGAGHNLTVTGAGNTTISGIIAIGAGRLSKAGTGRLTLTGVNSYTGDTHINDGELELDNAIGNVIAQSANVILASTGSPKLTIASNQTIRSLRGGGEVAIAASQRLTVNKTTGATTYNGVISGASGGLSKDGAGTLTLGGANTYGGTTEVNNGTLAITSSGALGNSSEVTVNSGGTLALNPAAGSDLDLSRGLTLAGGALASLRGNNTYSGNLTLTANSIIRSAAGSTLDVSGGLSLQTTGETPVARNLTIRGAGNVVLSGVIRGLGGLIKGVDATDSGRLRLTQNNTFAGAVNVNHGVLRIESSRALGTPTSGANGGTTVAAGATLELAGGTSGLIVPLSETLSLAGDGARSDPADNNSARLGALRNVSGNNSIGAAITLAGAATIHNDATGRNRSLLTLAGIGGAGHNLSVTGRGAITISGAITTGTGGLSKTGTGKLRLTGVNTYTGDTNINAGELELDNADGNNVIAQSANVILASTGSPKLSIASNQTIRSLRGGGEVAIAASRRLTVDQAGNTSYSGVISGAGAAGLTKTGTGTLTLSGANTYVRDHPGFRRYAGHYPQQRARFGHGRQRDQRGQRRDPAA